MDDLDLPVGSASAVLLGLFGVSIGKSMLGKIFGQRFMRNSALGEGGMVFVVVLVRTSHYMKERLLASPLMMSSGREAEPYF